MENEFVIPVPTRSTLALKPCGWAPSLIEHLEKLVSGDAGLVLGMVVWEVGTAVFCIGSEGVQRRED